MCEKRSLFSTRCTRPPLLATQNGKKAHLLAVLSACTRRYHVLNHSGRTLSPSGWRGCQVIIYSLIQTQEASARLTMDSQIAQEVEYILLVGRTQHIELRNHLVGFRAVAGMLLDGG
jgi:hypothetical protein